MTTELVSQLDRRGVERDISRQELQLTYCLGGRLIALSGPENAQVTGQLNASRVAVIEHEWQRHVARVWHALRDRANYPDVLHGLVPVHVDCPCSVAQQLLAIAHHLGTVSSQPVSARRQ